MSEEPTKYSKYEVQHFLGLKSDDFTMERIFNVYKQVDSKHYYYNILQTVQFPKYKESNMYTTYFTRPNEPWTLISYRHYNVVSLWWLIAAFNGIDNTFEVMKPGTRLLIPTPSAVRSIIDDIKSKI
mgnify:FL=1|jgi:hypothetical protein